MMTDQDPAVKGGRFRQRRDSCLSWIDTHPRVGWYIALLATINTVLHIIEIAHFFG